MYIGRFEITNYAYEIKLSSTIQAQYPKTRCATGQASSRFKKQSDKNLKSRVTMKRKKTNTYVHLNNELSYPNLFQ